MLNILLINGLNENRVYRGRRRDVKDMMRIIVRIRASIVVSIPACHAGDRSSILRLGEFFYEQYKLYYLK